MIRSPIKQIAFGTKGLYRCFLVEQKDMSAGEFQRMAESAEYRAPERVAQGGDEGLERAFWSSLTINPPIYGADTPMSLFDDRAPGWNLRRLGGCLLKDSRVPQIPGVTAPMVYFGMYKAFFSWHCEDLDLYSINYVHYGAPKMWYCIPPSHRAKFEAAMRANFPLLHRECGAFLRHKDIMVSPSQLRTLNVHFTTAKQEAGEFIVLNAAAYHCGFNTGFNCAEAVNFATPEWIPVGRRANRCLCHKDTVKIDMRLFGCSDSEEEEESSSSSSEEEEQEEERGGSRRQQRRPSQAKHPRVPQGKRGRRAASGSEEEEEEPRGRRAPAAKRARRQPSSSSESDEGLKAAASRGPRGARKVASTPESSGDPASDGGEEVAGLTRGRSSRQLRPTEKGAGALRFLGAVAERRGSQEGAGTSGRKTDSHGRPLPPAAEGYLETDPVVVVLEGSGRGEPEFLFAQPYRRPPAGVDLKASQVMLRLLAQEADNLFRVRKSQDWVEQKENVFRVRSEWDPRKKGFELKTAWSRIADGELRRYTAP